MQNDDKMANEIYRFVLEEIDSVPHLEALLLLWNSRPQPWTLENLSRRLYVSSDIVKAVLEDLVQRNLIARASGPPAGYQYESESPDKDAFIAALDSTYRREVVRISNYDSLQAAVVNTRIR